MLRKIPVEIRPKVKRFAERMEAELQLNDHKGGWQHCEPGWVLRRIGNELDELRTAFRRYSALNRFIERHMDSDGIDAAELKCLANEVVSECADVANFAMMLSDLVTNGNFFYEDCKK